MKKFFVIFLLLNGFLLFSCSDKKNAALEYNDKLVKIQVTVNDRIERLFSSFKNHLPNEMDSAYNDAIATLKFAADSVKSVKPFDGNPVLHDALLQLFDVYRAVLDKEFKEMIELSKLPEEQYTQKEEEQCRKLEEQIMQKIDAGIARLNNAQEEFLKTYGINLETVK